MAEEPTGTEAEEDEDDGLPEPPGSHVRARVGHIADLMRRHAWRKRPMIRDLAEEWGVSKKTVRTYSAEASRVVVSELPSGEEAKVGFIARMEEVFQAAMQDGAYAPAIESQKFVATLCGLMPATKTKNEHSGPDGGPIQTAAVVVLPPLDPEE